MCLPVNADREGQAQVLPTSMVDYAAARALPRATKWYPLNRTPYTLHPETEILNPKSWTEKPKP